jgi:hypothetical protein
MRIQQHCILLLQLWHALHMQVVPEVFKKTDEVQFDLRVKRRLQ